MWTNLLCLTVGITAVVYESRDAAFTSGIDNFISVQGHEIMMFVPLPVVHLRSPLEFLVIEHLADILHYKHAPVGSHSVSR